MCGCDGIAPLLAAMEQSNLENLATASQTKELLEKVVHNLVKYTGCKSKSKKIEEESDPTNNPSLKQEQGTDDRTTQQAAKPMPADCSVTEYATFLDAASGFLGLRIQDNLVDIVDDVLLQETEEEGMMNSFSRFLEQFQASGNDLEVLRKVLALIAAISEAYSKLPREDQQELPLNFDNVIKSTVKCLKEDTKCGQQRSLAVILEGVLWSGLLRNLMALKCAEAGNLFVEFCAWFQVKLKALVSIKRPSSKDIRDMDSLKRAQGQLFQILRKNDFLWDNLALDNGAAIEQYFNLSYDALSKDGCEIQAAVMLAKLGLICGAKLNEALKSKLQEQILQRQSLKELWTLLGTGDRDVVKVAILALTSLIFAADVEWYMSLLCATDQTIDMLKPWADPILKCLLHNLDPHEDQGGFVQYFSGFLMSTFLVGFVMPNHNAFTDVLRQTLRVCQALLTSPISLCRAISIPLLFVVLVEPPSSDSSSPVSIHVSYDDAKNIALDLAKALKELSNCKPFGFLGQRITLPPQLKKTEWWDERLNLVNRTLLNSFVLNEDNVTADVAVAANSLLKCMCAIFHKFSMQGNQTFEDKGTVTELVAQSIYDFCNPKELSWLEPLVAYSVVEDMYSMWTYLYSTYQGSNKEKEQMTVWITCGIESFLKHKSFNSNELTSQRLWGFMMELIPFMCENVWSNVNLPSEVCVAQVSILKRLDHMEPSDLCEDGDQKLFLQANKLTALLRIARCRESVSLSDAEDLAQDVVEMLQSQASNSISHLFEHHLAARLSIMCNLLHHLARCGKVFVLQGNCKPMKPDEVPIAPGTGVTVTGKPPVGFVDAAAFSVDPGVASLQEKVEVASLPPSADHTCDRTLQRKAKENEGLLIPPENPRDIATISSPRIPVHRPVQMKGGVEKDKVELHLLKEEENEAGEEESLLFPRLHQV